MYTATVGADPRVRPDDRTVTTHVTAHVTAYVDAHVDVYRADAGVRPYRCG